MTKPLLVIVDDEPGMAEVIGHDAGKAGFEVEIATNGKAFQDIWDTKKPAAVITDIVMPDMDGIELLQWLAGKNCSVPVILVSGYAGKYLDMASQLGAGGGLNIIGTLSKPVERDSLKAMLKQILVEA